MIICARLSHLKTAGAITVVLAIAACSPAGLSEFNEPSDLDNFNFVEGGDDGIILRMARDAIDVGDYGTALTILTQAWRAKPKDPCDREPVCRYLVAGR